MLFDVLKRYSITNITFYFLPYKMLTYLRIITTILIVSLLPIGMAQALTGSLTIAGTGDATNLLRALASSFEERNPGTKIIIPDSVGSSGGLKLLQKKRTDLARIARALTPKEKNMGLIAVPFALSPIVFTVNKNATQLSNISVAQIIAIYNGSLTKWRKLGVVDLDTIYPLTREEGDSSLRILEKAIGLYTHCKIPPATVLYSTPKTIQTLLRYKQTIGFIPMSSALGTDLQVLAIDNVYPSLDNVQTGKYKYVVPLSIVRTSTLSPLGEAFIKFLTGLEGLKTIFVNGAIPVI